MMSLTYCGAAEGVLSVSTTDETEMCTMQDQEAQIARKKRRATTRHSSTLNCRHLAGGKGPQLNSCMSLWVHLEKAGKVSLQTSNHTCLSRR